MSTESAVKNRWKVFRKVIYPDKPPCIRQKTTYKHPGHPGWEIISVKHAETHADGTGSWTWTDYITVSPDAQVNGFHRLMDAKEYVETEDSRRKET